MSYNRKKHLFITFTMCSFWSIMTLITDNKEFPSFTGIAIAIVAGVAIVIGMFIVTVGLVIFKR